MVKEREQLGKRKPNKTDTDRYHPDSNNHRHKTNRERPRKNTAYCYPQVFCVVYVAGGSKEVYSSSSSSKSAKVLEISVNRCQPRHKTVNSGGAIRLTSQESAEFGDPKDDLGNGGCFLGEGAGLVGHGVKGSPLIFRHRLRAICLWRVPAEERHPVESPRNHTQ